MDNKKTNLFQLLSERLQVELCASRALDTFVQVVMLNKSNLFQLLSERLQVELCASCAVDMAMDNLKAKENFIAKTAAALNWSSQTKCHRNAVPRLLNLGP